MALMKPNIDPDEIPYDSERLVYRALKEQLGNDFVVLHSYPWLRPDRDGALREGEADFIILHQKLGMLVLEVKGGELRYRNATWERKKRYGFEPITDPFKQARNSMHYLVERIERHSSGDVQRHHFSYGHAVVFPHDNYTGNTPPGADDALILCSRDMDNLAVAIERAFASWPKRDTPISDHKWRKIATALLPEFKLFRPIVGAARDVFEQLQEMTNEQVELLEGLYEANDRVYVVGVAGSGKTQIAFDRAIALAKEDKRTLFVCYNKYLAEYLDRQLGKHPNAKQVRERLAIRHFHGFARDLIEDADIAWRPPEDSNYTDAFFVDTVPDQMEQAAFLAMDDDREFQYDAIVIDEAQDFHFRWWEVLQCTLLKNAGEGILFAFADPVQRLWDWAPVDPPVKFSTNYLLRRNCRNSRWIAKTSTTLAMTDAKFFKRAPLGGKPIATTVASMPSMKGIVTGVVEDLLKNHDLSPRQIVLMGPKQLSNGSLGDLDRIGGVPLTSDIRQWWRGDCILVTTARSFKGLETDAVIIYDVDRLSAGFSKVDLYVACTRARSHVHFLATGREVVAEIKAAIAQAKSELMYSSDLP